MSFQPQTPQQAAMMIMNSAKAVNPTARVPNNGITIKATSGKVQIQMIKASAISSEKKLDSLNMVPPLRTISTICHRLVIQYQQSIVPYIIVENCTRFFQRTNTYFVSSIFA